ncbi:zinc finger protein 502-like isoform X2 [Labeo rohita]|uniref:Zinc finger protein 502-like isoform X2 n=1 Tax=Labeo rohita TaxID=84645 RepID=A0A498M1G5_LABRO|nr:zinc finger protein 502-like isoform X2 [Labeo rohita]
MVWLTFFLPLYTGSISDKEITKISGILPLLEAGDEVMADKGFVIEDLLSGVGAKLIIPPFKRSAQFTREDTEKTQAIARLRIVVERVIGRIKSSHIWDSPVPHSDGHCQPDLAQLLCLGEFSRTFVF